MDFRCYFFLLVFEPTNYIQAWPQMYRDCSVFPSVGAPQERFKQHPPVGWVCEPHTPTTFAWCMENCFVEKGGVQNCSKLKCSCTEHCFGTDDVCTGAGARKIKSHTSFTSSLNARKGDTVLLLNGLPPELAPLTSNIDQHVITIRSGPSMAGSARIWFMVDVGVGILSPTGAPPASWTVVCNGTRSSFSTMPGSNVSVNWLRPHQSLDNLPPVLRVAAANMMGNITVTAAVLNATLPRVDVLSMNNDTTWWACTKTHSFSTYDPLPGITRKCVRVPPGTPGASSQTACESMCLRGAGGAYTCGRCAHVYDAERDGGGMAFEDLPATWVCPVCGAPKSAYTLRILDSGQKEWSHSDS